MGIAGDLGYGYGNRSGFQRAVASFFGSRPGAWLGKWLVPLFDKITLKLTGGKSSASDWLAGLPPVWLITTGAKTGALRRHPLYGFPVEDDLAIIGSNFGQERHPAWVHNLLSNPEATVEYQSYVLAIRARRATDKEAAEAWRYATNVYPGYAKYRKRAAPRDIQVFILEAR